MRCIRLPGLVICTILSCTLVHGQGESAHQAVAGMFTSPENVLWTQSYSGLIDGLHAVGASVGFDGDTYRGQWTLLSSGQTFDLIGTAEEELIKFEEIDNSGVTSGYLMVDVERNRLTGEWWSRNFDRQHEVYLTASNLVQLKSFEPQILIIEANTQPGSLYLTTYLETRNSVAGVMLHDGSYVRLFGDCDNDLCTSFEMQGVSSDGLITVAVNTRSDAVSLHLMEAGKETTLSGEIRGTLPLQAVAHADYSTLADASFPLTGVEGFDQWMRDTMHHWLNSNLTRADEKRSARKRWSMQASGWADITYINNSYISGILTLWMPLQGEYDRHPFIYDIRQAKFVTIEMFARKGADVAQSVAEPRRMYLQSQSVDHRHEWLLVQEFDNFCLSPAGIVAFTDFNPIYGEARLHVPVSKLVDTLKKSAISKLWK